MQRRGFDVTAIEIADSTYAAQRVFSIRDDDGRTIPLPGASVDVAFSSNVPEHVAHLPRLHAEICRVLAPGGSEIHCSRPTAGRSGTTLTSYSRRSRFPLPPALNSCPRAQPSTTIAAGLIPDRPGRRRSLPSRPTRGGRKRHLRAVGCSIRAGGGISSENGFAVVAHEPMGLFYTGEELLGLRLGLAERARLARVLGSSCHLFRLVLRRLA